MRGLGKNAVRFIQKILKCFFRKLRVCESRLQLGETSSVGRYEAWDFNVEDAV